MKTPLLFAALLSVAACTKDESPAQPPSEPGTPAPMEPPRPPPPVEVTVTSKSAEAVEAFKKARDLAENFRQAEAAEQLKKAIELDAEFSLAHAYLGELTPGTEGDALFDKAMQHSATLPEAERTVVEAMSAARKGDEEKARALAQKVTELAPTDWRAHFTLGALAYGDRKYEDAVASMKRASELNPNGGAIHNMLGYANLELGKNDDAIAAFKKYAEVANEPNAHDSLAEALMRAGRFEEAEASFLKAHSLNPQFWFAWQGVAFTKAFRGDWAGAKEALAKAKEAAPRPQDRVFAGETLAWFQIAEGKTADAMKTLDAVEKEAEAQKLPLWVFIPSIRAFPLHEAGKYKDALKQVQAALERGAQMTLPGMGQNNLRRGTLFDKALAEARMGKPADAEKTLAELQEEAKKFPSNVQLQSNVHHVMGAIAWAKGDPKAAADHFAQCVKDDSYCHWQHALAMEKAGDATGAEAMKEMLRTANRRDTIYLYVRGKLGASASATPAPAAAAK
jgi:tetratricopeptide (TPR) repeat protein